MTQTNPRLAALPIEQFDVSQPHLFQSNEVLDYFRRLRNEAPVHYCAESAYGPYWSVTRFEDIVSVDTQPDQYSSQLGGIQIVELEKELKRINFISMDPPDHGWRRKVVSPAVAPANLAKLEGIIRSRVTTILDELPRQEPFDWVDRVSIELTTQMLATLFDFPFEERRKLTWWSEVATLATSPDGPVISEAHRLELLEPCVTTFSALLAQRANEPVRSDMISMLAHSEMAAMDPQELMGTLILLIVGGNDTTRNSISGGLLALHERPDEWQKLRENPSLVDSLVPEIIRWQTPLPLMRRTTTSEVELHGKRIPKGEKVIMWYLSGNRDETVIPDADEFIVDRKNPRHHLSFGFGIHRCMGNRLAEMQLRVLWEEILAREMSIEVIAPPKRTLATAVRGFTELMVQING